MGPFGPSHVDRLIEAGLRGDRGAFDALYEVWFAGVWSAAQRDADRASAESATANALQKAVVDRLQGGSLGGPAPAAPPGERRAAREV